MSETATMQEMLAWYEGEQWHVSDRGGEADVWAGKDGDGRLLLTGIDVDLARFIVGCREAVQQSPAALAAKDEALRATAIRILPDGGCWCEVTYDECRQPGYQHDSYCQRARAALALTPAGRVEAGNE